MTSHHTPPHNDVLGTLLQADVRLDERLKKSNFNTNLVRILKLALPLIAIILVVVLLVWSDQIKVAPPVDKRDIAPDQIGQNKLINPRFESKDEKSQPYTITAVEAIQKPEQPDIVGLISPTGSMNFNDGTIINIKSQLGNFDQKKQILNLSDTVKLQTNDGYVIDLNSVTIDMVNKMSQSNEPVTASGKDGIIKANNGFTADSTTGILTFKGPVNLIIHNNKAEPETP